MFDEDHLTAGKLFEEGLHLVHPSYVLPELTAHPVPETCQLEVAILRSLLQSALRVRLRNLSEFRYRMHATHWSGISGLIQVECAARMPIRCMMMSASSSFETAT